ncbi:hypothetical protein SOVF_211130 [Spinacia oleracea]|nr:hypothetical protein SOVF_211130 [Spinacia oleracea]
MKGSRCLFLTGLLFVGDCDVLSPPCGLLVPPPSFLSLVVIEDARPGFL